MPHDHWTSGSKLSGGASLLQSPIASMSSTTWQVGAGPSVSMSPMSPPWGVSNLKPVPLLPAETSSVVLAEVEVEPVALSLPALVVGTPVVVVVVGESVAVPVEAVALVTPVVVSEAVLLAVESPQATGTIPRARSGRANACGRGIFEQARVRPRARQRGGRGAHHGRAGRGARPRGRAGGAWTGDRS
ncbi:hypothetical protein [Nannocystis pusilla]|uniref:hypothetical protein n=1 Tax=Nannocystis pusilla TaxID=889268 RepID=UPI003B81FECD